MPTVVEILKEIRPEFDFEGSQDFVKDGILDSYDIMTLVSGLENAYAVSIPGLEIVPENFKDIASIQKMVETHQS